MTTNVFDDPVFVKTARALAAEHHVDVDVVINTHRAGRSNGGIGARTLVGRRHSTVQASPALTREPAEVQAFTAAHEIAHVVLRHHYRTRAWPCALWTLCVSAVQVVALLTLLGSPVPSSTSPTGVATAAVVAAGFTGPLVAGVGAQLLLAWRTRACETAADRLAHTWGYALPAGEAALAALLVGETRISTSRWYRPFRMHPLPTDRVQSRPNTRPDTTGGEP